MWTEISKMAKIELLHVMFMIKIVTAPPLLDDVSDETFFSNEKPSDTVLHRWKCILDICRDNDLI